MNNDQDQEKQVLRRILNNLRGRERSQRDAVAMASRIARLADKDMNAMRPDHAEEICAQLFEVDKILDFQSSNLGYLLDRASKINLRSDRCRPLARDEADLKASLTDLRLTIMSWGRQFEDELSETEQLEVLRLPSEEEIEAEEAMAYRITGTSLLRQKPPAAPGAASDGTGD